MDKQYMFILTFKDGHKQQRFVMVDKSWSLEAIIKSLTEIENVVSVVMSGDSF